MITTALLTERSTHVRISACRIRAWRTPREISEHRERSSRSSRLEGSTPTVPLPFLPRSYQSILSDSDTPTSSALLSFILSASSRRGEDAARYGPRPSYSARRATRGVHPEDLIRRENARSREAERERERKRERERERERGRRVGGEREKKIPTPTKWSAGPRVGPQASEQAVPLHTPEGTLAQRTAAPGPAPQAIKKNPATPNDFFPQPHLGRTLITFLSEITLRGERRGTLPSTNGNGGLM